MKLRNLFKPKQSAGNTSPTVPDRVPAPTKNNSATTPDPQFNRCVKDKYGCFIDIYDVVVVPSEADGRPVSCMVTNYRLVNHVLLPDDVHQVFITPYPSADMQMKPQWVDSGSVIVARLSTLPGCTVDDIVLVNNPGFIDGHRVSCAVVTGINGDTVKLTDLMTNRTFKTSGDILVVDELGIESLDKGHSISGREMADFDERVYRIRERKGVSPAMSTRHTVTADGATMNAVDSYDLNTSFPRVAFGRRGEVLGSDKNGQTIYNGDMVVVVQNSINVFNQHTKHPERKVSGATVLSQPVDFQAVGGIVDGTGTTEVFHSNPLSVEDRKCLKVWTTMAPYGKLTVGWLDVQPEDCLVVGNLPAPDIEQFRSSFASFGSGEPQVVADPNFRVRLFPAAPVGNHYDSRGVKLSVGDMVQTSYGAGVITKLFWEKSTTGYIRKGTVLIQKRLSSEYADFPYYGNTLNTLSGVDMVQVTVDTDWICSLVQNT